LKPKRWGELKNVISSRKLTSVLEFGSGVSTLLFSNLGLKVFSLETDSEFLHFVRTLCPKARYFHWDNITMPFPLPKVPYDLSLVDGIVPRLTQINLALANSRFIALDDFIGGNVKRFSPYIKDLKRLDSGTTPIAIFQIS
jgi:hypothetical protein